MAIPGLPLSAAILFLTARSYTGPLFFSMEGRVCWPHTILTGELKIFYLPLAENKKVPHY